MRFAPFSVSAPLVDPPHDHRKADRGLSGPSSGPVGRQAPKSVALNVTAPVSATASAAVPTPTR